MIKRILVGLGGTSFTAVALKRAIELARAHGLPVAPDWRPAPGEGEIFVKAMYRLPLAAVILVLYCAACVLILAPELRRGLFDRWQRRLP